MVERTAAHLEPPLYMQLVNSRAFGRRLKHVALVPFADCFNHDNVQASYRDCLL
jgi:hypothetical protein